MKSARNLFHLLCFALLCYGIASVGGLLTISSIDSWYNTLNKPAFNPPTWVFAPTWTFLYATIAVAGWRVWRCDNNFTDRAVWRAYAAQLLLTLIWPALFFYLRLPTIALVAAIALWLTVTVTVRVMWRRDRIAGGMLIPYWLWVGFAVVLNGAIVVLNR